MISGVEYDDGKVVRCCNRDRHGRDMVVSSSSDVARVTRKLACHALAIVIGCLSSSLRHCIYFMH
jgi:hypothetical protein